MDRALDLADEEVARQDPADFGVRAAAGPRRDAFPAIGDYAAIGNCRTIALVSKDGAVEWLCLPDFSGPSLFGAILDRRAGHFSVRPSGRYRVERAYVAGTNVLQTTFHAEGGVLRVTDCLTLPAGPSLNMQEQRELDPEHELLRLVECLSGEVEVEVSFAPRNGYGASTPRFANRGKLGWQCTRTGFGAFLHSDTTLAPDAGRGRLFGSERLCAGESRWLSFCYDRSEVSVIPPLGVFARRRLDATIGWWKWWSGRCRYTGPHAAQVLRSALALKLLSCATSGAVLAAATTSLPEQIGGPRNWDYRFCWIRDSALVLHAFFSLGYLDEGEAFLGWLLHATRLTWPRLQVMYNLYGETRLKERELRHLSGYRGSRPVRIGNAAHAQLQTDIYGELVATVAQYVDGGGELDISERKMLAGLCRSVCELWREPDQGIWETRSEPRHHTYSKAMCWVALDRMRMLNARMALGLDDVFLERESSEIRCQIERHGFSTRANSYVAYYGGAEPDASLLLLSRYGYCKPDDARMSGTFKFIEQRLSQNGMLRRYPPSPAYDGVAGGENLFAACSFWAAEYLANANRREQGEALFERLLSCANDVGLYAEEVEPATGAPVGNFPQAFTHLSLISAATAINVAKTA